MRVWDVCDYRQYFDEIGDRQKVQHHIDTMRAINTTTQSHIVLVSMHVCMLLQLINYKKRSIVRTTKYGMTASNNNKKLNIN